MNRIFWTGDPKTAKFPASRIAKQLGIDYPDVGPDPEDKDADRT